MRYLRLPLLLSAVLLPNGLAVAIIKPESAVPGYIIILVFIQIVFSLLAWYTANPIFDLQRDIRRLGIHLLPLFALGIIALLFWTDVPVVAAVAYLVIAVLRQESKVRLDDFLPRTILEAVCGVLGVLAVIGILVFIPVVINRLIEGYIANGTLSQ